jgi:hypothetical protein
VYVSLSVSLISALQVIHKDLISNILRYNHERYQNFHNFKVYKITIQALQLVSPSHSDDMYILLGFVTFPCFLCAIYIEFEAVVVKLNRFGIFQEWVIYDNSDRKDKT